MQVVRNGELKKLKTSVLKNDKDVEKRTKEVPGASEVYSKFRGDPHKFEPPNISDKFVPPSGASFEEPPTLKEPP